MNPRAKLILFGACLAAFFTAFEVRQPVFSMGQVSFTTSELAAGFFFLTMAIWAAANRAEFFSRRALDLPVALFVLSNFLSLGAAADKAGALKFALRMTFAALIYLGISRLPARAKPHLIVTGAITAALLVVTAIGLLESFAHFVYWPHWLSPWQEGSFTFGNFYNLRISSTLPFPTVLSMFLELALPPALALSIWLSLGKRIGKGALYPALIVVGMAAVFTVLIYTFTRAALFVMPLMMLAVSLLALAYGYQRRVAGYFALGATILLVILSGTMLTGNKLGVRLGMEEQAEHYGAEYTVVSFPDSLKTGGEYMARIRVKNTSTAVWKPQGSDQVLMAYRWLDYSTWEERDVRFISTELPGNVEPGGVAEIDSAFAAPDVPGRYVLVMELAKGNVGWFSVADITPVMIPLEIDATGSRRLVLSESKVENAQGGKPLMNPSRRMLWEAAFQIWKENPVLGVGPGQFRKVYSAYLPNARADERLETHNIYLAALANNGVIGLAAMLFLLGSTGWAQFKLVRNRSLGVDRRLISIGLMAALIAYLTHGVVDYFLWQTGITFLLFVLIGLTAWLDHTSRPEPD